MQRAPMLGPLQGPGTALQPCPLPLKLPGTPRQQQEEKEEEEEDEASFVQM